MYPKDFPSNVKDFPAAELDFAANLQKIASSRYLLALLKEYLDEPDERRRQLLAAQIALSTDDNKI